MKISSKPFVTKILISFYSCLSSSVSSSSFSNFARVRDKRRLGLFFRSCFASIDTFTEPESDALLVRLTGDLTIWDLQNPDERLDTDLERLFIMKGSWSQLASCLISFLFSSVFALNLTHLLLGDTSHVAVFVSGNMPLMSTALESLVSALDTVDVGVELSRSGIISVTTVGSSFCGSGEDCCSKKGFLSDPLLVVVSNDDWQTIVFFLSDFLESLWMRKANPTKIKRNKPPIPT